MKPKDIVIGKKYKHELFPGTIYLGCGNPQRKNKTKELVVAISSSDEGEFVLKRAAYRSFWKGFSPID